MRKYLKLECATKHSTDRRYDEEPVSKIIKSFVIRDYVSSLGHYWDIEIKDLRVNPANNFHQLTFAIKRSTALSGLGRRFTSLDFVKGPHSEAPPGQERGVESLASSSRQTSQKRHPQYVWNDNIKRPWQ